MSWRALTQCLYFILALGVGGHLLSEQYCPLTDDFPFLLDSLKWGLPVAIFFCLFLPFHIRMSLKPWSVRARVFVVALSLVSIPALIYGVGKNVNGFLDDSRSRHFVVTVTGKEKVPVMGDFAANFCSISVQSWSSKRDEMALRLRPFSAADQQLFESIEPYTAALRIETMPGKLGHEWIKSVQEV